MHRLSCRALAASCSQRYLPPVGERITSTLHLCFFYCRGIMKAIALLLNSNSEGQSLKKGFDMNKRKRQLNRRTNGSHSKGRVHYREERDYKIERDRKQRPLVILASSTWGVSACWCI